MPDLDLTSVEGSFTTYSLLRQARPALIDFGDSGTVDIGGWADRVQFVEARYEGVWELPVLGEVPAPVAVLVRPDGHVAWLGDGTDTELSDALGTWFGSAES